MGGGSSCNIVAGVGAGEVGLGALKLEGFMLVMDRRWRRRHPVMSALMESWQSTFSQVVAGEMLVRLIA
jgi:hypothetical protein